VLCINDVIYVVLVFCSVFSRVQSKLADKLHTYVVGRRRWHLSCLPPSA